MFPLLKKVYKAHYNQLTSSNNFYNYWTRWQEPAQVNWLKLEVDTVSVTQIICYSCYTSQQLLSLRSFYDSIQPSKQQNNHLYQNSRTVAIQSKISFHNTMRYNLHNFMRSFIAKCPTICVLHQQDFCLRPLSTYPFSLEKAFIF